MYCTSILYVCTYVMLFVLQIMYPTVVGMKTDLSGVLTVCTHLTVITIYVITVVLSLSFCHYLRCLYIIYHYRRYYYYYNR